VLLDLPAADGTWGCYAGQAAALRTRLLQHVAHKDHWRRALLIQRDTTLGYNSAQIGWLEGRLYDLFDAAGDAQLHNGNRPSDETLPAHDRLALEASIAPIRRILRLLGYDPATPDGQATTMTSQKKTAQFHGISLQDLLGAGYVDAGASLTSTNGAWPATATVALNGSVQVGGVAYPTPSAAASAVKGGATNGWEFWAVQTSTGNLPLPTLRARYADQRAQQNAPAAPTA
jgi:hypothetical protein